MKDHIYEQACRYLDLGWSVIPLAEGSKRALIPWAVYQHRLPSQDELLTWFHESMGGYPDSNIALVTGELSGVVSLDVDGSEGEATLEELEMPRTPWFRTGKGKQYLFQHPKRHVSNFVRKRPGIDFRGDGGYVVLPPSVHPNGRRYEWVVSPHEANLAPMPGWLLALFPEGEGKSAARPRSELPSLVALLAPHWTAGQRHALALGLAGYLSRLDWPWPLVRELLGRLVDETGDDEFEDRLRTLQTTYRRLQQGEPIAGYRALRELLPASALEQLEPLAKAVTVPPMMRKVDRLRVLKGVASFHRKRRIAQAVAEDMKRRGRFLREEGGRLHWFDNESRRVLELGCAHLSYVLGRAYGLNPTEDLTAYVRASLETEAGLDGAPVTVYRLAHWDGQRLYVDAGDGRTYVLDGESIREVCNGDQGVFFAREQWQEPWTPDLAEPLDPCQALADDLSYQAGAGVSLTPQGQGYVLWLWIRTLFFEELQPTKPILVLTGDPGSGKTSAMRRLLVLLYGPRGSVHSVKDEGGFLAALSHEYLLVLDNVDKRLRWLPDCLDKAATGQMLTMRRLYTTNEMVCFFPRCALAMTSVAPPFEESTVADRMLILKMTRRKHMTPESALVACIVANRSRLWAGLLVQLNRDVIAAGRPPVGTNFRMADWASLASRFAQVDGKADLFAWILRGLAQHQAAQVLENSPLPALLDEWHRNGEWLTTAQLHNELASLAEQCALYYPFKNVRGLTNHLRNVRVALTAAGLVEWRRGPRGYVCRVTV